jgi:hypothetical protein
MCLKDMFEEKREEYRQLFLESFGVTVDEFWNSEEDKFDFPMWRFWVQCNYNDCMEYQTPLEWEQAIFGPEVAEMMTCFGAM